MRGGNAILGSYEQTNGIQPALWSSNKKRTSRTTKPHGSNIGQKSTFCFRLGLNNVSGLPETSEPHPKHVKFREFINKYQLDGVLIQEPNQNWSKVKSEDRLNRRIQGWFNASRCILGYNCYKKPKHTHQWGGTAIVLTNKLTPQSTNNTTTDHLGRWTSVVIQGKRCFFLVLSQIRCNLWN